MVSRNPRRGSSEERRHARKMEKVARFAHSGFAGMSIIEMLEERLDNIAAEYVAEEGKTQAKVRLRGQIQESAVAIAMMRHPYKRYEQVWWNYVRKIEKRAVIRARETYNSDITE